MSSKFINGRGWLKLLIFAAGVAWVAYVWTAGNHRARSDCAYVTDVYRAVLDRAPDKQGYEGYCKALISGSLTRDQILQEFLGSSEYRSKHK